MTATDAILQRRDITWYVGKAIYVPPSYALAAGYPTGYYRVHSADSFNWTWSLDRLRNGRPSGEPIYIHDGSRDLKADPMTVIPGMWEWVGWGALWLAMQIAILAWVYEPGLVSLFFLAWLLGPFFTWFVNVEPVRGTKVAYAILGAQAALAIRRRADKVAALSDPFQATFTSHLTRHPRSHS